MVEIRAAATKLYCLVVNVSQSSNLLERCCHMRAEFVWGCVRAVRLASVGLRFVMNVGFDASPNC